MKSGLTKALEKIGKQYACITVEDAEFLLLEHHETTRLLPVLVRCGGKRFRCALQSLKAMIRAVENDGDYIRDVSACLDGWHHLGLRIK